MLSARATEGNGPPGPVAGGAPDSDLARLLERRPSARIVWGLERIGRMLAALGDPHREFRSVHVGGTNGKGSVAATVEGVLRRAGLTTGLYTSPHLIDFSERIRIGGEPADPALLEACAADVLPLAEREDASFFEAATALGFLAFARAGVRVAAIEVGLGGRLDATNVVRPEVAVVTNVAFDHAEYLGETLTAIAREKAGILKEGAPVVLGRMPQRIQSVFLRRAAELEVPAGVLGRDAAVEDVRVGLDGTSFTYRSAARPDGLALRTPLIGAHQADNAAVALLALERFAEGAERESAGGLLDHAAAGGLLDHAAAAVAAVDWPGRFQLIRTPAGTSVLDVAHNAAGAAALAHTLVEVRLPRPLVVLAAILGDKPWRDMLDPLLRPAAAGVFTIAPSSPPERRWDPHAARTALGRHRVEVVPEFDRALDRARELAGAGTVIVCGSCHTVGDALRRLEADSRKEHAHAVRPTSGAADARGADPARRRRAEDSRRSP